MNTSATKVACAKCGAEILPTTAERHGGKCAPCSARKWYLPFLHAPGLILSFVLWPFAAVGFLFVWVYIRVATIVPGTKANLRVRIAKGWLPDWNTVKRVWAAAPRLYPGPIGPAAEHTLEFAMLASLTNNRTTPSSVVADSINEHSPMLAAYCIELLQRRRETAILASLPGESLAAARSVDCHVGCIVTQNQGEQGGPQRRLTGARDR